MSKKVSVRIFILCLSLGGCAFSSGPGIIDDLRERLFLISYGDPQSKVLDVLGPPADRSFSGTNEAWQYCQNTDGFSAHSFATVYLKDAAVTAVTTSTQPANSINCSAQFPVIDWGQVPANVEIDVNVNSNGGE